MDKYNGNSTPMVWKKIDFQYEQEMKKYMFSINRRSNSLTSTRSDNTFPVSY